MNVDILVFEASTGFILLGYMYVIMPVITLFILSHQWTKPVLFWIAGGLLIGMAALFSGLQGKVPAWVTLSIASMCFHAGNLARIQSLRIELNKPWAPKWIIIGFMLIQLIFNWLHFELQDVVHRSQFTFLVGGMMLLHLAQLAWKISEDEKSPSARWIAIGYFAVAIVMLIRVVLLKDYSGEVGLAKEGMISQLMVIVMLFVVVVGHIGYVGMYLDRFNRRERQSLVEEVRRQENQKLGQQIAYMDRKRTVSQMSETLGHEISQPISAILINAQMAERSLEKKESDHVRLSHMLNDIVKNARMAGEIINRVRGMIKPSKMLAVKIEINSAIEESINFIAHEIKENKIEVVFNQSKAAHSIIGDRLQINQVLINMLRNSVDALQTADIKRIEIELKKDNGRIKISIRNTGPAIDCEVIKRIGEPFYTTKKDGLGLGYAISKDIIEGIGGTLHISNSGKTGVEVGIILPEYVDGALQ
jgi:signal transduction histidine kinase